MNIPILRFNKGEFSPLIDARSDVESYSGGCRHLQNFIPTIYGAAVRRPGTYYIIPSYGAAQIVRLISFVSPVNDYILEFGDKYIRAFYADEVIETISSPYLQEDLFQLQHTQVGDVMWIVHSSYAPRKLSRIGATAFSLDIIQFTTGPFLLRNDLIDPNETDSLTMTCSVTARGDIGTLTAEDDTFDDDHVGALFKLVHPRVNTSISQSGAGTSSALDCKGTCSFVTTGAWQGKVILQRRENSTSDNDWEDFHTVECVTSGARNDSYSFTEDADNVEYRIYSVGTSGNLGVTLTVNNPTQEGIVRITAVNSATEAEIIVLTELASTNATKRWAEGAWSDYRNYPSSVTFMGDRCIYAGNSVVANQLVTEQMEDSYEAEGDGATMSFYGGDRLQTHIFTATETYSIYGVELKLCRGGSPGTITVSIRPTTTKTIKVESGSPYTAKAPDISDLCSGTTNGNTLTTGPTYGWREIVFTTPVILSAGTKYAIVVKALDGNVTNYAAWLAASGTSATYEYGEAYYAKPTWPSYGDWATASEEYYDGLFRVYRSTSLSTLLATEKVCWLSETGDYENFEEGVKDADSFSLVIPTTCDIAWVDSIETLVLGTSGEEWQIGSNNLDTPITPTNFTVKQQSAYGCNNIQPLDGGEALLFVDFVGRKIREMVYRDTESKYVSPDLTALAEHITLSGIVDIAMQHAPDQILWCVLGDGSLVVMVYEREQNVVAWAKMPIDGFVKSICVGAGIDEDEIWLSILRGEIVTYEGETLTYENETVYSYPMEGTYIEKMMPRVFGDDIANAFFVDCGLTIENNPASATISGLDHLIGKTVKVLGDGVVYEPTDVVDVNGEVTISAAVSKAQIGLPFTYKLMPMRPDISTGEGTTHSSLVKVPEMGISFLNTMNAKYGVSDDALYDIDWENLQWTNNSEIDGLFTGDVVVSVDGGFTLDNNLIISGSDPLPCTVRALIPKLEQTGR